MSDDIGKHLVKRLREEQPVTQDWVSTAQCALQDEAADTIDTLRARVAELEAANAEAMHHLNVLTDTSQFDRLTTDYAEAAQRIIARAALKE